MLFAEGDGFYTIIVILLFAFGASRIAKTVGGSPTGKAAVKKGGAYLITKLFK